MPSKLTKPKNPKFEKTRRRGADGRFLPVRATPSDVAEVPAALGGLPCIDNGKPMSRKELVLGPYRKAIKDAVRRHNGLSIALVGSVARDEDSEHSDYDFLVRFGHGASTFTIAGLKMELGDLLGCKVDVIVNGRRFNEGRYAASILEDAVQL